MSFKKTKVFMLPTNEKATVGSIVTRPSDNRMATVNVLTINDPQPCVHQHLYFLSDEEIKEGDYNVPSDFSKISDISRTSKEDLPIVNDKVNGYKKIIATTDNSLEKICEYKNGTWLRLPQPSQSFIEKFVEEYNKGNVITEVLVEYEDKVAMDGHTIIGSELKISKDNTITIRKVKDSWNRDEVRELLITAYSKGRTNILLREFNEWLKENL